MIIVISGTNRKGAMTHYVAKKYFNLLSLKTDDCQFLSMQDIDPSFVYDGMYGDRKDGFLKIMEDIIIPADKFVFVMPEYNGSVPGFLKMFIDACAVKESFHGKKAALVGVAAGRAGNLRGLDHMTNILGHIKINVLSNKIPISGIGGLVSDGELNDEATISLLEGQMEQFINF